MVDHGCHGLGNAGGLHNLQGLHKSSFQCQAKFVVVAEHRKKIKVAKKGSKSKDALKRMGVSDLLYI